MIILICVIFILSSLSKLSELRMLDLSGNYFGGSLPSVIEELTRLEELKLDNCMIKYFPEG